MKVLILGAAGIIGQTMRLCVPAGVTPIWHRKTADALHVGCDLTDPNARLAFLDEHKPDVIVNLAGESSTDRVEGNPQAYQVINTLVPYALAEWCDANNAHLIHVSTQAVFDGLNPPYKPDSPMNAVNWYGWQKIHAERLVRDHRNWTIVRPTFVLGVRPLPHVGRANPVERMLDGRDELQVGDRFFSVAFAHDVAELLWDIATDGTQGWPRRATYHVGTPDKVSRHDIARLFRVEAKKVPHSLFANIAPRPLDTTYEFDTALYRRTFETGVTLCKEEWKSQQAMTMIDRAKEISLFLGIPEMDALERLGRGWSAVHNDVSECWRRANPQTEAEILNWYRTTEAYIWELSYYHADAGWNYAGTCAGIAERLKAEGARRVLCLGDGIGDLTLTLEKAGLRPTYHDLAESRTAEFAKFRLARHGCFSDGECPRNHYHLTGCFVPISDIFTYDAIVSLDFLEHVTNVDEWARAIYAALKPGGWFCAQNAFAIGSGEQGSMPMHLACNDKYEKEWQPLLEGMGFVQDKAAVNWWRKAA
jgi:dTDP-4-dehydrorhamnose reductase